MQNMDLEINILSDDRREVPASCEELVMCFAQFLVHLMAEPGLEP